MNDMTHRLPPHNSDAERGLLGGILRDPETIEDALQFVAAESFYFDAHGQIFRAMIELAAERKPIDMVLLCERLKLNKQL